MEQDDLTLKQKKMKNRFKEKKIPDDYHTLDRAGQVTLICLHIGHYRLNLHMQRWVNLVPSPPCTCGTEDQTTNSYGNMSIIPTSQRTDMVRQYIIAPGTVWEERITREDNWLHSAGWLIHILIQYSAGPF